MYINGRASHGFPGAHCPSVVGDCPTPAGRLMSDALCCTAAQDSPLSWGAVSVCATHTPTQAAVSSPVARIHQTRGAGTDMAGRLVRLLVLMMPHVIRPAAPAVQQQSQTWKLPDAGCRNMHGGRGRPLRACRRWRSTCVWWPQCVPHNVAGRVLM